MAELFTTLLLGVSVGLFIGLLLSTKEVRKNHLFKKYFSFNGEKSIIESEGKCPSQDDEEDEVRS